MNLQNLKISTQLTLGLGLILAMVVGLGVAAYNQSGQIWLLTRNLYEHPLTTRRALGTLEHDFLEIRVEISALAQAVNADEIKAIEQQIALHDA